jgi:serine/threonine protein phosphatase 1
MMKYFVVADVHSFYDAMMKALEDKGFDKSNPEHKIIICGDLFDRGPDAKRCFEFVSEMLEQDRAVYVCGNHEDLLIQCVNDMIAFRRVADHHIQNGTLDTIVQFTGLNKYDLMMGIFNEEELLEKIMPLVEFIVYNCDDYYEVGDHIFVHGWIPCTQKRVSYATTLFYPIEDWRSGDWGKARWINGIEAAYRGIILPGKTIVCGHFHCSYGWSKVKMERKEFPSKSRSDWAKSFEIYTNDGIVAIDACTAFTGFVNCYTIEVE